MSEKFVCRNCDWTTDSADADRWDAAQTHADDEDHIVDVFTRMSSLTPSDVPH